VKSDSQPRKPASRREDFGFDLPQAQRNPSHNGAQESRGWLGVRMRPVVVVAVVCTAVRLEHGVRSMTYVPRCGRIRVRRSPLRPWAFVVTKGSTREEQRVREGVRFQWRYLRLRRVREMMIWILRHSLLYLLRLGLVTML
jgi:hypothetical protein